MPLFLLMYPIISSPRTGSQQEAILTFTSLIPDTLMSSSFVVITLLVGILSCSSP